MLPTLLSSEVLALCYAVLLWHSSRLLSLRRADTQRGRAMRCHRFISLLGGVTAAWSFAAHAQDSATVGTTKAPTATTSTQIEVVRVKPVDRMSPDLRLSDNLIDLMKDSNLPSAQGIGGAWSIPPRASTPFEARYG